jgi:DNA-binding beta-propeller fold protein YncE
VVTADGAIVQEHTLKGLDGLAPAGTVRPLLGRGWDLSDWDIEPRLGVLMNPYTQAPIIRQLFVSEPFDDAIAVLDLVTVGTTGNEVFALAGSRIRRIRSEALNVPVDLTPATIDTDNIDWASNTTLDDGSDLYVANRGDNTIVRLRQDGSVVAIRRVKLGGRHLEARLNGIASSPDGSKIYATFTGPREEQGGVLEVPAFDS